MPAATAIQLKRCSSCGYDKPTTSFRTVRTGYRDGLHGHCVDCEAAPRAGHGGSKMLKTQVASAIRVLPRDECIQVTPDDLTRKVAAAPEKMIPRIGLCDWQPAGDGTFRPIVRIHDQYMRMNVAAQMLDID